MDERLLRRWTQQERSEAAEGGCEGDGKGYSTNASEPESCQTMRYVLDTTAFSAAMGRDAGLLKLLREFRPGDIVTVPPVVAEIQYGIERLEPSSKKCLLLKSERDRILSTIKVLPWSPQASNHFGKIKAHLEHLGKMIDDFDIAIGAIAIAHKCGVITINQSHFNRIKDLGCKSWK